MNRSALLQSFKIHLRQGATNLPIIVRSTVLGLAATTLVVIDINRESSYYPYSNIDATFEDQSYSAFTRVNRDCSGAGCWISVSLIFPLVLLSVDDG